MAITSHHTTNWFEVMSKGSKHKQNINFRVVFLGNFVIILRIPWGCLNGDKSVIFNALSTQWMAHAFRFGSLTRWSETMSDCVHKRKVFYPIILTRFHYNSGNEFNGWHWFFVSGTLQLFAVSIALGSIGTGSPTHRSDCIKQQVTFA